MRTTPEFCVNSGAYFQLSVMSDRIFRPLEKLQSILIYPMLFENK